MKIEVTADKGRFLIKCPYMLNHLINGISGKRWWPSRKVFVVPFSRKAAEAIAKISGPITISDDANALLAQAARQDTAPVAFPVQYPFKTSPMDHQRKALDFLWNKKVAALFMAMRTGKTKTTIDWACALQMDEKIDSVLVFCPISVRSNWQTQMAEHAPIDALIGRFDLATKSGQRQQIEFSAASHQFKMMVVGIESMSAGGASELVRQYIEQNNGKRMLCVVDESHYIKTPSKTRTEVITMLGSLCEYRVILTGTPIAASPLDLYAQFGFLDPFIVGYSDYYSFKNRYTMMGGFNNKQIIGYANVDELMSDIQPYVYQVNAEEVADLPPKIYQVREIELPAKARKLYNSIARNTNTEFNGELLVCKTILEKITRMISLVNGVMTTGEEGEYRYHEVHTAKINELIDLIEGSRMPTVVWTTRRLELAMIVKALNDAGYKTAEIHGDVCEDDRIKAVADFQEGRIDYLVANTSVGGTGIKLSRARMLVYMSNSFKYVDRKQSEERATDFINVGESVLVVDIIAKDTVDDTIVMAALQKKADIAQYVNENIERLQIELSVKADG